MWPLITLAFCPFSFSYLECAGYLIWSLLFSFLSDTCYHLSITPSLWQSSNWRHHHHWQHSNYYHYHRHYDTPPCMDVCRLVTRLSLFSLLDSFYNTLHNQQKHTHFSHSLMTLPLIFGLPPYLSFTFPTIHFIPPINNVTFTLLSFYLSTSKFSPSFPCFWWHRPNPGNRLWHILYSRPFLPACRLDWIVSIPFCFCCHYFVYYWKTMTMKKMENTSRQTFPLLL